MPPGASTRRKSALFTVMFCAPVKLKISALALPDRFLTTKPSFEAFMPVVVIDCVPDPELSSEAKFPLRAMTSTYLALTV